MDPNPTPAPADYPYNGPSRLHDRRPYAFAPYHGAPFLDGFARSRRRLELTLGVDGTRHSIDAFDGLERLCRDAHALRPEVQAALDTAMDRLRAGWEVESARQPTDTAEILDEILLPYLRARVPLRARGEGPAWAHDVLLLLIERFEVYGCVHASYDHQWRKVDSAPNQPAVLVRLALAAGWLAWGDLLVDPAASLTHLNALLKIVDLVDAGVHHDHWELTAYEREAMRAVMSLESRLLRHWRRIQPGAESMEMH